LYTCVTVWSYEDFNISKGLKALVKKEKKRNLFDNAPDIDLVKISAIMSSVIFNLALQQIPRQYPKEAFSASFLIQLEPSYITVPALERAL
jgi:hypothetical protein